MKNHLPTSFTFCLVPKYIMIKLTHRSILCRSIHTTVQKGFARASTNYDQARTNYTSSSIEWLLGGSLPEHLDPTDITSRKARHDVLDLGAGTGKLSRAVIEARPDLKLVGVDPVAAMCAQYASQVPEADVLQGNATGIPLLDSSVYTVVVGQAFHWFASAAALSEISRVLVPGGGLGMIWNTRDTNVPWVQALDDIVTPYYSLVDAPRQQSNVWKSVFESNENNTNRDSELFQPLETRKLQTIDTMTYDGILAHILSLSVIAELNQDEKRKIEKKIHELMHEHPDVCSIGSIGQPNELGTFAMPYTTEIYITQSLKQLDTSTASSLSRDNMSEQEAEALGLGTQGAVVTGTTTRRSADASPAVDNRLAVKDVASEALQLDDFFGGGAAVEEDEDEDFVDFTDPSTGEWNSPTRGGKLPEPTRHGDWHHNGRCTDFS